MSTSGGQDAIRIAPTDPRLVPQGYEVKLSVKQATMLSEFVDSPVFKLLKSVYVAQRKDHIARMCLNGAQTAEQLHYFKGQAAELVLFFKNLDTIKEQLKKLEKQEKQ